MLCHFLSLIQVLIYWTSIEVKAADLRPLPEADLGCSIPSCSDHKSNLLTAKIASCKIVVASPECQSLVPNVRLRNCESEAFCPDDLDQDFIAGCIMGAGKSAVGIALGLVTTPSKLIVSGIQNAEFEAHYFNSAADSACDEAEKEVNKSTDASTSELDCEQSFLHAACPRTLLRNCKNRLLEEFPDIKASYGNDLAGIKYEKVLFDVHQRLKEIEETKPSLVKFLRDNPISSGAFYALVTQALVKQGYKFKCMSSYDVAHFSCDKVIKALAIVYAGYRIASKLTRSSMLQTAESRSILGKSLSREKYPFLYSHASSGRAVTLYRSNRIDIENVENLDQYLEPGLNPDNVGIIDENQRLLEIQKYLKDGEDGAKRLYEDHVHEVVSIKDHRVNLVSSWWEGHNPLDIFGKPTPEALNIVARARIGKETPILNPFAGTAGTEAQLFSAPPAESIDWFLNIGNKYYKITDKAQFARFIKPEFKQQFGSYKNMSLDQQSHFWISEMEGRYKIILESIEKHLKQGDGIGLESTNEI